MHEDTATTDDKASFTLDSVDKLPDQKEYTVLTGLLINGKEYKKGSKIELDEQTANNFKKNGDIKDA